MAQVSYDSISNVLYSCAIASVSFLPHVLALKFTVDCFISIRLFMMANLHLKFTLLMIPFVLSSWTPLPDYSLKSIAFIMSFHTLSTCRWHLTYMAQAPECKTYSPFQAPHPELLRNKLAIAFLFNFSIYFSPSLYPTNYSAIQLQNGLINKLGFFSLWPSWDVFPLLPIISVTQSYKWTSNKHIL